MCGHFESCRHAGLVPKCADGVLGLGREVYVVGRPTFGACDVVVMSREPFCQLVPRHSGPVVNALENTAGGQNTQGPVERGERNLGVEESADLIGSTRSTQLAQLLDDESPGMCCPYPRFREPLFCEGDGRAMLRGHGDDGTL